MNSITLGLDLLGMIEKKVGVCFLNEPWQVTLSTQ